MKGWLSLAAVLIMLLAAVPSLAATDRSIAEYENLVSTYSIDAGIPSYDDYRKARDEVRPDCRIVLEGADVVRYEEEGAAEPALLTDYAGMPGVSLLTGEEALAEWEFTVEEEGWYDPCLEYYPYAGKNSEIQRAFFIDGQLPYDELSLIALTRVWRNDLHDQVTRETDRTGSTSSAGGKTTRAMN